MAESGESMPRTSELYVGIVDVFAVLLPGAIIAFVIEQGFQIDAKFESLKGGVGWAVFFAASYIAGHLVSALGGLLLDKIYDTSFKLLNGHSAYFRIRVRARDVEKSILGDFYSVKDNAMEWAEVITHLASPAASSDIDRLEGDSKFFRSLCLVLIVGWPIYLVILVRGFGSMMSVTGVYWLKIFALVAAGLSFVCIVLLRYFVHRQEKLINLQ